jgi:hypothetical protein
VAGYTLKYQTRDVRIRSDLDGFNVSCEFGNNRSNWTGHAVRAIFHYITRQAMNFILKH